eukprot:3170025-Amphidinium_carterae.1
MGPATSLEDGREGSKHCAGTRKSIELREAVLSLGPHLTAQVESVLPSAHRFELSNRGLSDEAKLGTTWEAPGFSTGGRAQFRHRIGCLYAGGGAGFCSELQRCLVETATTTTFRQNRKQTFGTGTSLGSG